MIINNINVPTNTCRQTQILKANDIPVLTIGRGSYIVNASIQSGLPTNLHIGQFCSIATNITFMLQIDKDYSRVSTSSDQLVAPLPNTILRSPHIIKGQIILQNDVWVGHNATIMGGVIVGNGAIVSTNAHVVKSVPPYAIVGGNPAKVIKYRFTEEQIADLLEIAWWNWSDQEIMERKPDFSIPIQEFIDKYRVPVSTIQRKKDIEENRILLFPDFDAPYPLWKRIVSEYCDKCRCGQVIGQLFLYMPEDSNTDRYLEELTAFLSENYDDSGDIYVQVGQIADESELFAISDYLVTSRVMETVRYTCLANKFRVKILSGADLPVVFSESQL